MSLMMISYASVDRIENGKIIICEVENVPMDNRQDDELIETFMADVDIELFKKKGLYVHQGDIFSVTHEDGVVTGINRYEYEEKLRRIKKILDLF